MSLQPGKADEAKILVPSLGMMLKETPESPKAADVPRLGDEELDFLLNAMSALCNLNQ